MANNCPKFSSCPGQSNNKIPLDRRIFYHQRKRKLKIMKSLNKSSSKFRRSNEELLQIEFRLINSIKFDRDAKEARAVSNIKFNPKFFYSFSRKHKKIKCVIGPLKVNDELITSAPDISEALSAQYSSVFSTNDPESAISDPMSFFDLNESALPTLTDINFSEQMIEDEISSLKNNSAPGPDKFPVALLKACKKEFSKP